MYKILLVTLLSLMYFSTSSHTIFAQEAMVPIQKLTDEYTEIIEENDLTLESEFHSIQLDYRLYEDYLLQVANLDVYGKTVKTKNGSKYVLFDDITSLKLILQRDYTPIYLYNNVTIQNPLMES